MPVNLPGSNVTSIALTAYRWEDGKNQYASDHDQSGLSWPPHAYCSIHSLSTHQCRIGATRASRNERYASYSTLISLLSQHQLLQTTSVIINANAAALVSNLHSGTRRVFVGQKTFRFNKRRFVKRSSYCLDTSRSRSPEVNYNYSSPTAF